MSRTVKHVTCIYLFATGRRNRQKRICQEAIENVVVQTQKTNRTTTKHDFGEDGVVVAGGGDGCEDARRSGRRCEAF